MQGDFSGQIIVWLHSPRVQEQTGIAEAFFFFNLTASSSALMQTSEVWLMKSATANILTHRLPKAGFWRGGEGKWNDWVPPTDTEENWAIAVVEDVSVRIYSTSSRGLLSLLEPKREQSLWGSQWGGWWLFIFQMFSHVW